MFLKLDNGLEAENGGSDLWLKNLNVVMVFVKSITIGFGVMGVYICSPICSARERWARCSFSVQCVC
jgi:hypothetical protein